MSTEEEPRNIKSRGWGKEKVEKNFRGVDEKLCYDNLDFDCKEQKIYDYNYRKERKDTKPYPEKFKIVADSIMNVCKSLKIGFCSVHSTMPGIQWNNESENTEKTKKEWKKTMHKKGNHYFHEVNFNENLNFQDKEDLSYCMCQEYDEQNTAFKTLLLDPKGDDEEWKKYHGTISNDEDTEYPEKYIIEKSSSYIERKVTPSLRTKIIHDSLEFLAEEYKIHLMPKPEYQIPVILELLKMLSEDQEFNSHIENWKAIIPYSRVIDESNLPSIVIYPVWGVKSAKIAIQKITQHFNQFNAQEIGLNLTPRYNLQFNELIYWANGGGDHKKLLPASYFTSPKKIFYIGHELY